MYKPLYSCFRVGICAVNFVYLNYMVLWKITTKGNLSSKTSFCHIIEYCVPNFLASKILALALTRQRRGWNTQLVVVWNCYEVAYGINPKRNARYLVMLCICDDYILTLWDYMPILSDWIKKSSEQVRKFFWSGWRDLFRKLCLLKTCLEKGCKKLCNV